MPEWQNRTCRAYNRIVDQTCVASLKIRMLNLIVTTIGATCPSIWITFLRKMAERDIITLMCIDEVHSIEHQGRFFRPDFQEAVRNLQLMHDNMKTKCPRLVMSATLRNGDQLTINKLFGGDSDFVLWMEMARRRITIDVNVNGNPTHAITKRIKKDLKKEPSMMLIWYANSKYKPENSLVPAAEKILEELGMDGEVIPLTGGSGIMNKVAFFFDGAALFVEVGFGFVDAAAFVDLTLFGGEGVIVDGTCFVDGTRFLIGARLLFTMADGSSAGEVSLRLRPADGWKLELTKHVTWLVAPLMAFYSPPTATDLRRGEAIAPRRIQPATMSNPYLGASPFGGMSIVFGGHEVEQ